MALSIYHLDLLYPFIYDTNEHRDVFSILTIVNNVSVSTGATIYFELAPLFSLDKHPGVEVLDHVVVLFLFFKLSVSLLLSFRPQPPKPDRIPVSISPHQSAASFLSN